MARDLLLIACSLAMLGCATARPASAPTTETAAAPQAQAAAPAGDDAQAQAEAEPRSRGRKATAAEYYREVMARAARRNVQVMWVHGPRGDGRIVEALRDVHFRQGL